MKHKNLILIILLFFIVSCNTLNKKKENVSLNLTDSFALNDKISELFITFAFEDRIIIFDECDGYIYDYNGNLLNTFGGKGKGPCELLCPVYCYYNIFNEQIVIYDIYAQNLVKYDLEGKYIESETITNYLIYKEIFLDFSVYNYRKIGEKITDKIEVIRVDSTIVLYEKEYASINDIKDQRLNVDANSNNIYVLDIKQNNYILFCFDNFTDLIYTKKGPNNNNIFYIYAGETFLIFASQDKDSGIIVYDILDLEGNHIESFTMNSDENYIADVYNRKLIKKVIGDTMKIEILNLKI